MPSLTNERRYLSIGEVLGLLLEEFPDMTISKIRFLESQGLIDPERTPSGYRKFFDGDVDRLRMILREQRENFLPLKVIKDRLDSGELVHDDDTPTGSIRLPQRPRGAAWYEPPPGTADPAAQPTAEPTAEPTAQPTAEPTAEAGAVTTNGAAAAVAAAATVVERPAEPDQVPPRVAAPALAASVAAPSRPSRPPLPELPDGGATDDEVCALAGVDRAFLRELESYRLVSSHQVGVLTVYDADAVQAVVAAAGLCRRGLEPRHLRLWRTTVDKEIGLIEQLVVPLMRQRNPRARVQASEVAHDIEAFGSELRAAMMRTALHDLMG